MTRSFESGNRTLVHIFNAGISTDYSISPPIATIHSGTPYAKGNSSPFNFYIKIEIEVSFKFHSRFMSLLALSCMCLYLIRITHSVLRLLITFEVLSIIGATVLVLGILSGALQMFICVAVLTAVVGLTIWVCNN